jgi:glycosyltransferase involved in cell wall biosynthesis
MMLGEDGLFEENKAQAGARARAPLSMARAGRAASTRAAPLVSIIVPVYDVEAYLQACVGSLTRQTYQNLEIILVNDGSTDHSGAICDELAQTDARVRVIHKENGGLSSARNAGITAANGELIGFVDSDDLTDDRMFARLVEVLTQTEADLVKCGFVRFPDGSEPRREHKRPSPPVVVESPRQCLEALVQMQINPAVWNKLYRRELIGDLRFPEGKIHEDQFFTPQICLRTRLAAIIPEQLYFYRLRPRSITSDRYNPRRLDAIEAWLLQFELLRTHNVGSNLTDTLVRRINAGIEWNYRMLQDSPHFDADGSKRRHLQRVFRDLPTPLGLSLRGQIAHWVRRAHLGLLAHTREEP